MLGTLCTLITALTCVSGVTVVTQKPSVVTLRKGETATMDCNLGNVNDAARWYKQIPGGVPQYVLYFYHSNSSPTYGSGFSSPKFTSTHQSTSDYRLIINNVEEGDSAVYYCQTWHGSVKGESKGFADVSWLLGGSPVSSGISTSTAVQQADQTFQISSYLAVQTSDWNMDKVYTCVSGVTVVTQKPPVVTLRKGETATMDCNLGTVDNTVYWYKQIPGGVPQHVLRFYHTWSSPAYGSGFSSPKFTSTHQSTSDYRLIINNVEEGDSAVYYCHTWDNSAKEDVSQ
ncbi:hypothetical protein ABVT39_021728 [Epinephelus coioides]